MISTALVLVVAAIHFVIAGVEMFLWREPWVHTLLGYDQATADLVAPIVANAGLYNAFIGAGLVWSTTSWGSVNGQVFFLTCVVIAGVFGALTLKKPIVIAIQTVPGLVALAAVAWPIAGHARLTERIGG